MNVDRRRTFEVMAVILLSLFNVFILLWRTIITPGLIYVRDTYPPIFMSPPEPVSNGVINILFVMDTPDLPVYLSSYFLPSEVVDKLYYAYPIFLGFISMYFSSKYFLKKLIKVQTRRERIILYGVPVITAFLFTTSPPFMYFTYWTNYATFVALYPSLLATLDYVKGRPGLKGAIILALMSTLTTTDPRGFLYTILTVLAFTLYNVKDKEFLKTFATAIPIYIGLNIRTFASLLIQGKVYNGLGTSIEIQQLWLNYQNYPFLDEIRGVGLFRPLLDFYSNAFIYTLSLLLPAFVILAFILYFEKVRKVTNLPFVFAVYIITVIMESSTITLFNHVFTLNLIYYLNDVLKESPFFPYMWLILPTYVEEVIPPSLFLMFGVLLGVFLADVSNRFKEKYVVFLLLAVFLVTAQLTSSYTSLAGGDYSGNYMPTPIPKPLYDVAYYLDHHDIGKVVIYVQPIQYDGREYSAEGFVGLPNVTLLPFYNSTNISTILAFYGVQYVVTNEPDVVSFLKSVGGFNQTYCVDGIYVFEDLDFKTSFTSKGVYILATYPQNLTLLPKGVAVVPPYVHVPEQYLAGVIGGNSTYLLYDIYQNYSLSIPAQRLPYPTNFSCTIIPTSTANQILSTFPGAPLIQVFNPASESVKVPWGEGYYYIILSYVQHPGGGIIKVSNGSYSVAFNTNGELRIVEVGMKMFVHEEIILSHVDDLPVYIVGMEAIPMQLLSSDIHLDPKNVTVVYYPVTGNVIPSVNYNIVIGEVETPTNPNLLPFILVNLAVFITVLFEYFKRD
ncbi:hypothetical protein [Stygiolobus azoricus]|uniref:Uncharacterized protein n=1 Tax=Stygiolobus azoricus TaxID=41675 RepID=A0A650CN19_9CREN|nr:hypothetical protein [Stygiolobus azoricus]QGR19062.1 hypothetical protein D1868_03095 [Stygiolobus azoricus]